MIYAHIGLLNEAHEEIDQALELNPNNTMARFRVGVYYAYQAKFEDALRVFKTIPHDVSPMLVDRCRAEIMVQTGREREAEEVVEQYLIGHPRDEGGSFTSVKAVLLAKSGRTQRAEQAIGQAARSAADDGPVHHTAHNIASAYAALDRPEEAVPWLETAADTGFPNYTYFQIDPNLDPIRANELFESFMKKLRPQWERYRILAAAADHSPAANSSR